MEILVLPEALDTKYAGTFLQHLRQQKEGFVLDGHLTQRIGGLCFQLLVSAYRTAQVRNIRFELRNISDQMKEDLGLLGGEFLMNTGNDV